MTDDLDLRFLEALKRQITQGEKQNLMTHVINNPDAAMDATEAMRRNMRLVKSSQKDMAESMDA